MYLTGTGSCAEGEVQNSSWLNEFSKELRGRPFKFDEHCVLQDNPDTGKLSIGIHCRKNKNVLSC